MKYFIFIAIISLSNTLYAQCTCCGGGSNSASSASSDVYAWEDRENMKLAKDIGSEKKHLSDKFFVSDYNVKLVYEWDEEEKKPKLEEEGDMDIVNLISYSAFSDYLWSDDKATVDYIMMQSEEKKRRYNLPTVSRSYESASIFSQDGNIVAYETPKMNFGETRNILFQRTHSDIRYFTNTFFQQKYYTEQGEIEIWVPSWLDAEVVEKNFEEYNINPSTKENQKWDEEASPDVWDEDSESRKDETYTVLTYSFKKLPKSDRESSSPGPTYYMPHLAFVHKGYDYEGEENELFKDVEGLYSWYNSLTDSLAEEPSAEVVRITDSLTQGIQSDEEKIRKLFYWVQDNIRYIAFEDGIAGFKPEEAETVCSKRFGDCKGMANLFKTMLVHAGFDARLTWLGTRRIAYDYSLPILAVDNHMITTVIKDGKKIFLDPTEEYISYGDLAHRIQGQQALIEDGEDYILADIPEFDAFHNRVVSNRKMRLKEDKFLVGNSQDSYHGESKTRVLRSYAFVAKQNKEVAFSNFVSEKNKNLRIKDLNSPDFKNREGEFEFSYDFELRNQVIQLNDNQLLVQLEYNPDFYYSIIDEERETDYEFSRKYHNEISNTIDLPSGYSVASMPDNIDIERDNYKIKVTYEQQGNSVKVNRLVTVTDVRLPNDKIEQWNSDIRALRRAYDEYLIIEK